LYSGSFIIGQILYKIYLPKAIGTIPSALVEEQKELSLML
jgi:hypothetical protein